MGAALRSGARYLSRAEESAVRARIETKAMEQGRGPARHRAGREPGADDRAFVDRVRDEVHDWLGLRKRDERRPASARVVCARAAGRTSARSG